MLTNGTCSERCASAWSKVLKRGWTLVKKGERGLSPDSAGLEADVWALEACWSEIPPSSLPSVKARLRDLRQAASAKLQALQRAAEDRRRAERDQARLDRQRAEAERQNKEALGRFEAELEKLAGSVK